MKKYFVISLFLFSSAMAEQSLWQKFVSWFSSEKKEQSSETRMFLEKRISIAVVKMKEVASKCKAGIGIDEQLKKINDAAKERLLPLEERVKKASENASIDDGRSEEMQAALYDTVRTERYQISEATEIAIEQLQNKLKEAISNIAEKKHLVVFDSDAVLSGKDVFDLTEEVISELDKICPHIEVKIDLAKR